jgi:hypothetical protein
MSKKENVVPFSEVNFNSNRVNLNFNLPEWVNMEQVGVNLSRLEFLMNIGGIKNLTVKGVSGEVSKTYLTSVGSAPDGSNYAGGLGTKDKKDLSNGKLLNRDLGRIQNTRWGNYQVDFNISEIQGIIQNKKLTLKDGNNWRPILDEGLRKEVSNLGTKNLLSFSKNQLIETFLYNVGPIFWVLKNPEILIWGIPMNTIMQTMFRLSDGTIDTIENGKGEGYRLSLIPGLEIDRALVLSVAAAGKPILTDMSVRQNKK